MFSRAGAPSQRGSGMYHLEKAFDTIRCLARRRLDFSHFSGECWSRVSLPPPVHSRTANAGRSRLCAGNGRRGDSEQLAVRSHDASFAVCDLDVLGRRAELVAAIAATIDRDPFSHGPGEFGARRDEREHDIARESREARAGGTADFHSRARFPLPGDGAVPEITPLRQAASPVQSARAHGDCSSHPTDRCAAAR
jgi:hypothetical protein